MSFDSPRPTLSQRLKSEQCSTETAQKRTKAHIFNIPAGRDLCHAMDNDEVFTEEAFRDNHSDVNVAHHVSLKSVPRAQS